MQRLVVSFALAIAVAIVPASVLAQDTKTVNQNQRVAEYIAGQLGSKFPSYNINVGYTNGVVTLAGDMHSAQQVTEAIEYVRVMPGITRVINSMKVTPEFTEMQTVAVAPEIKIAATESAVSSPFRSAPVPTGLPQEIATVAPATITPPATTATAPIPADGNVIAQVSGQVPNAAPAFGTGTQQPVVAQSPMPAAGDFTPSISTNDIVQPMPVQNISTGSMPLPMGHQAPTAGRYDQPNAPNYAWPSYAAPNNYAEVNYPRLYCPQAAPYIGPFYPYPQVPMGWRKATLEWHDGYWWMDFDDGSCNGPFSPLFRQPNPKRY